MKFKVGQKVKILAEATATFGFTKEFIGKTGVILSVLTDCCRVKTPDGDNWYYQFSMLEPIKQGRPKKIKEDKQEKQPQPKYKVGDKVKVIGETTYKSEGKKGYIGLVTDVNYLSTHGYLGYYWYEIDSDFPAWQTDLELVESKPVKTLWNLEVGDKVTTGSGETKTVLDTEVSYILSFTNNQVKRDCHGSWTVDQMKKLCFRPKGQPLTLTKKQIAEKYGVDVSNLIIKE
jgi:ribosomal protein L21E